jgi:hypothetical protein
VIGEAMAEALRRHNSQLFGEGIAAFREIWDTAPRDAMYPLKTPGSAVERVEHGHRSPPTDPLVSGLT